MVLDMVSTLLQSLVSARHRLRGLKSENSYRCFREDYESRPRCPGGAGQAHRLRMLRRIVLTWYVTHPSSKMPLHLKIINLFSSGQPSRQ